MSPTAAEAAVTNMKRMIPQQKQFILPLILLFVLGTGAGFGGRHLLAREDANPNGGAPSAPELQTALAPAHPPPTYLQDVLPILMGKCSRCHNDQSLVPYNWLDYRTAVRDRQEIKKRVWDSWKGDYFKQPMPAGYGPEFQTMTPQDRAILRDWVDSGAAYGVPAAHTNAKTKGERLEAGQRLFATICSACHQPTGRGIPGRFPPLAGSDFLNADKTRAIRVVLKGLQGQVVVNGQTFNNAMPRLPLNDEEIASALTFVYNSFGNSGKEVTPEEVTAVRLEKEELSVAGHQQSATNSEEKSPFE